MVGMRWTDKETKNLFEDVRAMVEKFKGRSVKSIMRKVEREGWDALVKELPMKEIVRLNAEKTKAIQEKHLMAQLMKERTMAELIRDKLEEAILPVRFQVPKAWKKKDKSKDTEIAVLMLSDMHIGKKTASYDSEVFSKRMDKFGSKIVHLTDDILRKEYNMEKLVIFFLGDIVDGQGIYPTHAHHIDQTVVNQIFRTGMPSIVEMLYKFAKTFKEIECHCIRGNHGRTGRFMDETANWDLIMYHALELATNQMSNIKWNIYGEREDWGVQVKVYDTVFQLVHGNQMKMYYQIPFYSTTTHGMRWQGSQGHFDYLCLGHFHTSGMLDCNEWEALLNGTWISGDEFAHEQLGLKSSAKQLFFGVHPKHKITWRFKLDVLEV